MAFSRRESMLAVAAVAATALCVALTVQNHQLKKELAHHSELPVPGDQLPPISVKNPDGKIVAFEPRSEHKEVVVIVFRSDCPVCAETQPVWRELLRKNADRYQFFALTNEPFDENLLAYIADNGMEYPVYSIYDEEFAHKYKARRIPLTIVATGEGKVRFAWRGEFDEKKRAQLAKYFDL